MLLQCVQVTRQYRQKGKVLCTAVKDASFDIYKDDFISIIGRSGSGKSTLLNMIAGLLCPTAGTILIEGNDVWASDERKIALLRNFKLGYIPQGTSLLGNLTAIDNVRLPYFLYKRKGDGVKRAKELLERVGLKGYENRYPSELSGGEMKRVAIARALMNDPVLLLADEPTADIDEETTGS
ncbi:MAG: ABC transporter ATP-binding protein, partial [Lachnospiraceae bacterium]|nr:ABC transporter ATP-binding protein [Lachnospiraceae bacterium]